eukprot:scpid25011/ scgid35436/ Phosphatidylinositol glycan anchor biosynthesis class U protein; Cell division cycle protein 91-like 1; GPI transamidase component PIG-U
MDAKVFLLGSCGLLLRIALLSQSSSEWLSRRIEVSTPLSSWRRVVEGITLLEHGYSPYEGDMFHQSPLLLAFFHGIWHLPYAVKAVFLILDVLVSYALYKVAVIYQTSMLDDEKKENENFAKDVEAIQYKPWHNIGSAVALAYWLNPFAIVTCAAHTTMALTTFTLAWCVLAAMRGRLVSACLALALASHLDPYMIVLIVPVALLVSQKSTLSIFKSIVACLIFTALVSALLLWASFCHSGSWDFLRSTYGFVFTVPDFTPNVGIFWYLFTEMFEHFRTFFLWVFQLHVFFYALPLGMRLWRHPFFLLYLLSHVAGVFKSYPSVGDTALPLTLLFTFRHLFKYMRNMLVVSVMFLASIILMPTFWYLWITAGSGNANFFYSGTLAYNLAHILLMSGSLTAFLRREFDLKHGTAPLVDGKPAAVLLE